jgi:hypothetical protein
MKTPLYIRLLVLLPNIQGSAEQVSQSMRSGITSALESGVVKGA